MDAIPPTVLRELVEEAILQHVDEEALRITRVAEQSEREVLRALRGQRGPVGYSPDGGG